MLAFISGQNPKHSNAARYVDDAVELGYLVDIYVPSGVGGRHKRYLTVACTAADRTGQTLDDIASEARQHKVRGAEENQDEDYGQRRPYEQSSAQGCERNGNT